MLCPKCGKPLIVVERNKIELDWCPQCGGFWFDADEWKLLGVNDDKYDPFQSENVNSKEKGRRCPVCTKIMHKTEINGILLDKCPCFHGIWFDKGELSDFVNSVNSDSKNVKTVNFLGEVLILKSNGL